VGEEQHPILFDEEDLDLLNKVLALTPEVALVALAGRRARAAKVSYPIARPDDLFVLLGDAERLVVGHHSIDRDAIRRHLPKEFFPIEREHELLSRVYLALTACRDAAAVPRAGSQRHEPPPVLEFVDAQSATE